MFAEGVAIAFVQVNVLQASLRPRTPIRHAGLVA
jgi:hypothetical protein